MEGCIKRVFANVIKDCYNLIKKNKVKLKQYLI